MPSLDVGRDYLREGGLREAGANAQFGRVFVD